MATLALTKDNFKDTIEKGGTVFIDWWAEWCGPCKAFAPVYERVAEANPDVTFAKIDTDKEQELAAAFGIRSIPTLMIFRDGISECTMPAPAVIHCTSPVRSAPRWPAESSCSIAPSSMYVTVSNPRCG